MAAETESAVDDDGARFGEGGGEQMEAPVEHHRNVPGRGHTRASRVRWLRSLMRPLRSGVVVRTAEREEAEPHVRRTRGGIPGVFR
ncbi:hypothetical protein GCM10011583_29610 [Streptomyces camponoticapitis]|uniref:Uncharacterized protein n=1 Tax=Streptomyces camponoticapitis TaxID=1616125 RepID=A0ABQ2E631_9ACTN|nr:hypothetical protein GCM10011583_29610 [Streptomyces camponoticapitis]